LARDAGAIIKGALDARMKGGQANILLKYDNPSDLVTETDQAVEKFIKERLSATYPAHK
jgi:myo-inositol-1(or 4)-monophosphatase